MTFRYYHRGPRSGWGFEHEENALGSLASEFTNGSLKLAGFAEHLTVVGHLRKGDMFFVILKPGGASEIRGTEQSHKEYERHRFDPFSVVEREFGVRVKETDAPALNDTFGTARSDEYVGHAAMLFRALPLEGRKLDYLSALPADTAPSLFPHTRFLQHEHIKESDTHEQLDRGR